MHHRRLIYMTRSASPREAWPVALLPRRGTDAGGALLLGPSSARVLSPTRGPVAQRCVRPLTAPDIEGAAPVAQQLGDFVSRICHIRISPPLAKVTISLMIP
jgi:hypothetical protein